VFQHVLIFLALISSQAMENVILTNATTITIGGPSDMVECPCFSRTDGLMWAYANVGGMSADIDR